MAIRTALYHRTTYTYDRPTMLGPHVIRLRPAPFVRTPVLSYALKISPATHAISWQLDPFGNWLGRVTFFAPATSLDIEVEALIEPHAFNPFEFFIEPYAENYPFAYARELEPALAPFLRVTESGPLLDALVARFAQSEGPLVSFLVALNQALANDIDYITRLEPGVRAPEETLSLKSGSCRDSAWLMVAVLRRLGIAARFVSGYLVQWAPDEPDDDKAAIHDSLELHAWAEAYIPGAGWIGFDPTSGLLCGEGHIALAATSDFELAAPVTGTHSQAQSTLAHEARVTRVAETPRTTKPLSEEAWQGLDALGRAIDADLDAQDVRLTMGGEPTYVAGDDPDADEWNVAALGTDEGGLRRTPRAGSANPFCAGRPFATRARQVVRERGAAALGL